MDVATSYTPINFRVHVTRGGACCSRPVTSTPTSIIDDHGGKDDYQTAEEDDKRDDDDRQLSCTGLVLETEHVIRNLRSTNVRLL